VLDCKIIYFLLIIEHNGDASPENHYECIIFCDSPDRLQVANMKYKRGILLVINSDEGYAQCNTSFQFTVEIYILLKLFSGLNSESSESDVSFVVKTCFMEDNF
jgi:hypothetical protein